MGTIQIFPRDVCPGEIEAHIVDQVTKKLRLIKISILNIINAVFENYSCSSTNTSKYNLGHTYKKYRKIARQKEVLELHKYNNLLFCKKMLNRLGCNTLMVKAEIL